MRRRAACLAAFALATWLLTGPAAPTPPTAFAEGARIRLATGPRGGAYYRLGQGVAALTERPGAVPLPVTALETSGSVTNIHLLVRGEANAAIVQADVLYAAVTGRPPFPERLPSLRAVAALFGEVIHIVCRADRGIETISDLKGKRVGLGAVGSGSIGLAADVLHAYGIGVHDFERRLATPEETLARFRSGQLDAFFLVTDTPSPLVREALASGGALLPIAPIKAATLSSRAPYLVRDTLPADTYPGQAQELDVVRVDAMLCVLSDLRSEECYELLRLFFGEAGGDPEAEGVSSFERLRAVVPALRSPVDVRADDLHAVPLHPGAMAYYGEREVFKRPVEVHTGIYTNDVFALDIAQGTFDVDFYLWFRFRGRLEADPSEFRFELMNGEARQVDPPVVERFGGYTYLSYKVTGRFRTSFPLDRFPFDRQVLPIVIEHPQFESPDLVFVADDAVGGRPRDHLATMIEPKLQVGEWRVKAVRQGVSEHVYETDMGSPVALRGRQRYSQYRYELEIARELKPYLVKVCAPLVLIVLMSFMVFFIPAKEFQVQVIVAIAALLACVAFHTAQADNMPQVGYMVTADLFFIVAYGTVFLTLLQVVAEHAIAFRGRPDLAIRLDRWARVVFPLGFFGVIGWIILGSV